MQRESGVNFLARVVAWCIIGAVVLVALLVGWVLVQENWRNTAAAADTLPLPYGGRDTVTCWAAWGPDKGQVRKVRGQESQDYTGWFDRHGKYHRGRKEGWLCTS
jgi:hypothetical protein